MTNSTMPATVKDAAAAIRADLKAAFPDTRFSVRMGTGTAAVWIDIKWTDGPNPDMVENVTGQYRQHGSPVEGICPDRRLSIAALLAAQEKVREALPDFVAYDADGKWRGDVPSRCPIFQLGGWRLGGGDRYSALASVADLLILNPRKGPGA